MISIYLFYLLHFIFFLIIVCICFVPIYRREKKASFPEFNLGENYHNFFRALVFYTKEIKIWLLLPIIIYCIQLLCGLFVSDNFSKVIVVSQIKGTVYASEKVVLIKQTLPDGLIITPFEKERVIINKSQKRLLLRRNLYRRELSIGNGGSALIIYPNSVFYCRGNYPEYILRSAPSTIHSRWERLPIERWSLTIHE